MKVEIKEPAHAEKRYRFPLLAKEVSSDLVYLFISETEATCILDRSGNAGTGHFRNASNCFSGNWTIYPKGTQIILTQE